MNYAQIRAMDVANGDGIRVSVFVSGCPFHCKGCFNREYQDFDYGEPFTPDVLERLLAYLEPDYIAGLSVLGGEPLCPENKDSVLSLIKTVKKQKPDKTVWIYTGYFYEDVDTAVLSYTDVLVDGQFEDDKKDMRLRFRGSSNQRLIDVPGSLKHGCVVLYEKF